ncbi:UDP-N-acetylmuramoyl-L-alanine--D-glutamate ligase [Psittacicella melopsittaci]|uniref:UDP-N-acetylmuramoylalanine--D-glutamate ligase n=1 Tax=Psittacicella melopsittaci TaxID=2028576 RepID=A0A3A1YA13_9GAMM|nr:UDP-N-acetylmuramoyl-L-alanine--D-glutamate ligase [Psittacicella melopsittaci]RIY32984.1 UDP-N-acetylmuramoyl-L-alanine--D-glutamate ligase [Psittacicella melopsittaci]
MSLSIPNIINIGIVGVKKSGFETARFLLTHQEHNHYKITLFDDKPDQEFISTLQSINGDIEVYPLNVPDILAKQNFLIVTPGIPKSHPAFAKAREQKVEIIGDIELFARLKNDSKDPIFRDAPVIGITGSNGKTTVTELTTHILQYLGYHVAKAGNVGVPVMSTLTESYNYYVLELSSYQLETTNSLKLRVGTILNVTPDHLDRYNGMEDYTAAKQHIYDLSQSLLYNKIDQATWPRNENAKKHMTAFTSDPVKQPASYFYDPQKRTLNIPTLYDNATSVSYVSLPVKDFLLQGTHNYENLLAAIALVRLTLQAHSEQQDKLIFEAARNFKGLPHRFELVHVSNNGVRFINDSKATNIGSVESALRSVDLHSNNKLYLLMGGEGKKQDFTELAPAVAKIKNIEVICYGRDAEEVAKCSPHAQVFKGATLETVMTHIAPKLKSNDVVLLSPGCASLDQFKNYEERGQKFTEIAKKYQKPSRVKRWGISLLNFAQNATHGLIYLGDNKNNDHTIKLYDGYLLALIFSIFGLGIITVFSSSVYFSLKQMGMIFNPKQALLMVAGVITFLVSLCINSSKWRTFTPLISILTIGALIFVHTFGHSVNGAQRWISLFGFTFQPVELAKLCTLIYLAHYLVAVSSESNFRLIDMLGFTGFFLIMAMLLLMQPDFGSTLMLIIISSVTIVYVTPNLKAMVIRFTPVLIVAATLLFIYVTNKSYLMDRITGFLDPYSDPYGKSYQVINSISAFSHGGFWGVGLGNSIFKSGYLTEANTDYILAIYGEEFGYIGIIILVVLEILLYLRMFKISHQTFFIYKRPFQAILVFTFVLWFAYQALYNLGMTVAFLPTDGSTHPLISYGGSSYVVMFTALGITMRIDYENRLIANGEKLKESRSKDMVLSFFDYLNNFFSRKKSLPQHKRARKNK